MTDKVCSKPHIVRAYVIITVLILLLFFSVISLLFGSSCCMQICAVVLVALVVLIVKPQHCILLLIPFLGFINCSDKQTAEQLLADDLIKGFSAVISTMGMVSFVLTYINTARLRKVKGILIEDVIATFFPRYKWILVINGCLACLGRFACETKEGLCVILCFTGMVICLCYMLHMANEVVFSEKRIWKATSRYIQLVSQRYLKKDFKEIGRGKFLNYIHSTGKYLAEHYTKNEFSLSHISQGSDVQSLLPLIRHDNTWRNNTREDNDTLINKRGALSAYEDSNADEFQSNPGSKQYCESCSVARIPGTKELRENIEREIRISYNLWKSVLDEIPDEQTKIQVACQFLYDEHNAKTKLSGVLGCGLIMYLHYSFIPDMYPADSKGWEKCMRFIYLMHCAANNETVGRNNFALGKTDSQVQWVRKRCFDLFVTLVCLMMVEQSFSNVQFEEKQAKATFSAVWETEKRKRDDMLCSNWIDLLNYQAFLLFYALPVPVSSRKNLSERQNAFAKVRSSICAWCDIK